MMEGHCWPWGNEDNSVNHKVQAASPPINFAWWRRKKEEKKEEKKKVNPGEWLGYKLEALPDLHLDLARINRF